MRYTISTMLATVLATSAMAEVPKVVTDFAPTYGLVSMVMGDLGQPEILLDKGANAHEFQLKPSQSAALQEAGLAGVVQVGPTTWHLVAGFDSTDYALAMSRDLVTASA